jgi:hypothetical protein
MNVASRFSMIAVSSNAKRLERLERLEPVGLIGAGVENKFFMGKLDQRPEGNRKVTVSD